MYCREGVVPSYVAFFFCLVFLLIPLVREDEEIFVGGGTSSSSGPFLVFKSMSNSLDTGDSSSSSSSSKSNFLFLLKVAIAVDVMIAVLAMTRTASEITILSPIPEETVSSELGGESSHCAFFIPNRDGCYVQNRDSYISPLSVG